MIVTDPDKYYSRRAQVEKPSANGPGRIIVRPPVGHGDQWGGGSKR